MPARKPGKLPWNTVEATYELEYGTDSLQIHADAISKGTRVIVHDDVLATGGTARAKTELVERLGGEVVGLLFVVELTFLNGRDKLDGLRRRVVDPVLIAHHPERCLPGPSGGSISMSTMYDALTARYTFACPRREQAHVALSSFRLLERLPGAAHPAVYAVRFDCRLRRRASGPRSHEDLDWAPLGRPPAPSSI